MAESHWRMALSVVKDAQSAQPHTSKVTQQNFRGLLWPIKPHLRQDKGVSVRGKGVSVRGKQAGHARCCQYCR